MTHADASTGAPETIVGEGFEVRIVRSHRRRTAALQVDAAGAILRVPAAAKRAWIESLIAEKARWIRTHLQAQAANRAPPRRYVTGERFEFLGMPRWLQVEPEGDKGVCLQGERLVVGIPRRVREPARYVRQSLVLWYRQQALEWLTARTEHYAERVGRSPGSVSVRTYRRRWGSCDAKGHLRFNWVVIAAPEPVIDYLVVHELCHLRHMNHSRSFWQAVGNILPDYAERRRWLQRHGAQLCV